MKDAKTKRTKRTYQIKWRISKKRRQQTAEQAKILGSDEVRQELMKLGKNEKCRPNERMTKNIQGALSPIFIDRAHQRIGKHTPGEL